MAILDPALIELDVLLDEVRTSLQFTEEASRLRPRLNDILRWETVDGETRLACQRFMELNKFRPETVYAGLYVRLYGGLEQFIRRVLRDVIVEIDSLVEKYDELDVKIQQQNIRRTGDALATILQPPDHFPVNYESLCVNIGSCRDGATTFALNADAFALHYSNITSSQLEKILKRIGIQLDWDDLGRIDSVQLFFDLEGKTRLAADETKDFLNKFSRTRNQISHNGAGGIVVAKQNMDQTVAFVSVFSRALVDLVIQKAPIPKKAARRKT